MYNGNVTDLIKEYKKEEEIKVKEKKIVNIPRFTSKEKKEFDNIEKDIENIEIEISNLKKDIESNSTDYVKILELQESIEIKEMELLEKLERWEYLSKINEEIENYRKAWVGQKLDTFASSFDVIYKLSSLLENKCDFGVRLKAAYDKNDREALARLGKECDVIIEKMTALRLAHRREWMEHNKPFGWEVHDIRYGGLIARFDTVKERIAAYLNGDIDAIEELSADRLAIKGDEHSLDFTWLAYLKNATPGVL